MLTNLVQLNTSLQLVKLLREGGPDGSHVFEDVATDARDEMVGFDLEALIDAVDTVVGPGEVRDSIHHTVEPKQELEDCVVLFKGGWADDGVYR